MKIIEQSHQLLPDQEDLVQQIGSRAAICYQADGDNPEANRKRVQHCLKNGHMSALEMGRITINCGLFKSFIYSQKAKYISHQGNYYSGSIRAWIECWGILPVSFQKLLQEEQPFFFNNLKDYYIRVSDVVSPVYFPEHESIKYQAVKFITNRAMSHELVRHRPCSFLQESQRYVRYDKPGGIEFIKPLWLSNTYNDPNYIAQEYWKGAMVTAETNYDYLLKQGLQPQQARGVLPNDTKTEIIVYTSLAEWRHIFYQRTQGGADPMMKALMKPVLEEFRVLYPGIFDELKPIVAGR